MDDMTQGSFQQDGESISPLSDRVRQLRDHRFDAQRTANCIKMLKKEIKEMLQNSGMQSYTECGLYITIDDTLKVKSLAGGDDD